MLGTRIGEKTCLSLSDYEILHLHQQPIPREEPLQFSSGHYRSLYTCFSLFVILYLPEPGYEDMPIGDELMEWLNIHFIEPSTEEGDELSSLGTPWEDEAFWPYLTRAVLRGLSKASLFFLDTLSRHPSEYLQRLALDLAPLVSSQPRLQQFSAERDFAHALRRWKDKVKALRVDMDAVPEAYRMDDFENWWDRLSDIVAILEGRGPVIQRVCRELGADWKEVCAAWGVFVDTRLRRQDLPDVVAQVLQDIPPDSSLENTIHADLLSDRLSTMLANARMLDPWLSAHMADILEVLGLIEQDVDEESELTLRDQCVLAYAEYLHSDPALWRIVVEYMYSCGQIGKAHGDEVLMRVPLRLLDHRHDSADSETLEDGDITGVLKEVNQTCLEHQREAVRRTVCKIAAQDLIRRKEYGLAIAYYTSAEEWSNLGTIVNRVLQEYVNDGPEALCRYAGDIASSVQSVAQAGAHGVFVYRLMFVVRYAQFHQALMTSDFDGAAAELVIIFEEEIVPKSWWAVLLCDARKILVHDSTLLLPTSGAFLLMRKLEEIFTRSEQGSGGEYLSILGQILHKTGESDILNHLRGIRLILSKYLARCFVNNVGGRQIVGPNFVVG
ncbi:hypothetical protein HGRIS_004052 [Hohenbuehelia grisea]|uniref:Nuclear pore complex protein Nup85 n=1 Tax=Hohenbuehelia grisea TaxID=104357 RepID=A0ABR3JI94_9AGAR